jgi:hypothetical protein
MVVRTAVTTCRASMLPHHGWPEKNDMEQIGMQRRPYCEIRRVLALDSIERRLCMR